VRRSWGWSARSRSGAGGGTCSSCTIASRWLLKRTILTGSLTGDAVGVSPKPSSPGRRRGQRDHPWPAEGRPSASRSPAAGPLATSPWLRHRGRPPPRRGTRSGHPRRHTSRCRCEDRRHELANRPAWAEDRAGGIGRRVMTRSTRRRGGSATRNSGAVSSMAVPGH